MHLEDITNESLEDYFVFPWEVETDLNLQIDDWRDLRIRVIGRGMVVRTDVPKSIQMRIADDFKQFRQFEKEIGFGNRLFGTFYDGLRYHSGELQRDTKLYNDWLQKSNSEK